MASLSLSTALLVAVTSAAAAAGSKDPKALVLQKADLPATAVNGPSFAVSPAGGRRRS